MTLPIPEAALRDHIASLGKTGSGKTSDTKVIVEHITKPGWSGLPQGARVCILDPIKSDWWGLTSSADGKKPGLPFQILGGPHGHVPLHSQSGKVIGELVASGALPLSILDMADFEPGGLQRFFADFAQALFRKNKGILYLVVEEAHEFAPKERSGMGNENLSIHWMKKLATGTRTKGIRLLVCSQRTQALHNAVLGSCETMIAGRFTAPADQEPVLKWFKANVSKEKYAEIAASMSSLKTGEAWVACGEADFLQRVHFPRIKTFDNSATPEHGAADVQVRTAPVDRDRLAQLIGIAAEEVASNDPKALKAKLATAETELDKLRKATPAASAGKTINQDKEARGAVRAYRIALEAAMKFIIEINAANFFKAGAGAVDKAALEKVLADAVAKAGAVVEAKMAEHGREVGKIREQAEKLALRLKTVLDQDVTVQVDVTHNDPFTIQPKTNGKRIPATRGAPSSPPSPDGVTVPQARVLASLAFWKAKGHSTPTRAQVAGVAGYRPGSGNFNNLVGSLTTMGHAQAPKPGCLELLMAFKNPGHEAAQAKLRSVFDGPQLKLVRAALAAPGEMGRDELAYAAGYSPGSGNFNNITGSLTTMDVLTRPGAGRVALSDWAREVLS